MAEAAMKIFNGPALDGTISADNIKVENGVIDNVKDFIYVYCQVLNLANMPEAVRKRLDKLGKGDYDGNMKFWAAILDKQLPTLKDDGLWEDLYNMFQRVFENMDNNQSAFWRQDTTVRAFFNTWYGEGKMFQPPVCIPAVEERVADFANFLEKNKAELSFVFNKKTLGNDFNYDRFVKNIKDGKYKTDLDVRDLLFQIVQHTQSYARTDDRMWYSASDWPAGVEKYDFSRPRGNAPAVPIDTDEWFKTTYNPAFKHEAWMLFDKLLTSKASRDKFMEFDRDGIISKQITRAIEKTDYANAGSTDYVTPDVDDRKNIVQRVEKKLEDFRENQLDPWFNVLKGRRKFFTPWARAIVEGIQGVKVKNKDGKEEHIKPTGGLMAILENKDAIKDKFMAKSPKGKGHFDWFIGKLEKYSKGEMKKTLKGAFIYPDQMQALISRLAVEAIDEDAVAKAETAMEVISCIQYGIFTSRMMDSVGASKWDFLSNEKYSFNKYAPMRIAFRGTELAARAAVMGMGRVAAAMWNNRTRRKMKFNGKSEHLVKAQEQWKKKNNVGAMELTLKGIEDSLEIAKKEQTRADAAIPKDSLGRDITRDQLNQRLDQERSFLENALRSQTLKLQTKQQELQELQNQLAALQPQDDMEEEGFVAPRPQNTPMPNRNIPGSAMNMAMFGRMQQKKKKAQKLLSAEQQQKVNELQQKIIAKNQEIETLTESIEQSQEHLENFQPDADYTNGIKAWNTKEEADNKVAALESREKDISGKIGKWDNDHIDKFMKLMGFWDLMQSYSKTHQFSFNAKKMRDDFLENFGENVLDADGAEMKDEYGNKIMKSKAEETKRLFLNAYIQEHGGYQQAA